MTRSIRNKLEGKSEIRDGTTSKPQKPDEN